MRAFIGIRLYGCHKEIVDIQNELKQKGITGNYTLPENIHLTLFFIGELKPAQTEKVKGFLQDIGHPAFNLCIEGINNFKDMIILQVKKENNLMLLYDNIAEGLREFSKGPIKRSFFPHITLVRKANGRIDRKVQLKSRVTEVILFSSERFGNRLTYVPVHRINLKEY